MDLILLQLKEMGVLPLTTVGVVSWTYSACLFRPFCDILEQGRIWASEITLVFLPVCDEQVCSIQKCLTTYIDFTPSPWLPLCSRAILKHQQNCANRTFTNKIGIYTKKEKEILV